LVGELEELLGGENAQLGFVDKMFVPPRVDHLDVVGRLKAYSINEWKPGIH
jgi:hypothetical protein